MSVLSWFKIQARRGLTYSLGPFQKPLLYPARSWQFTSLGCLSVCFPLSLPSSLHTAITTVILSNTVSHSEWKSNVWPNPYWPPVFCSTSAIKYHTQCSKRQISLCHLLLKKFHVYWLPSGKQWLFNFFPERLNLPFHYWILVSPSHIPSTWAYPSLTKAICAALLLTGSLNSSAFIVIITQSQYFSFFKQIYTLACLPNLEIDGMMVNFMSEVG